MATEKYVVTGDQYRMIDRKMREIKRQLDQRGGSPLDPNTVSKTLQEIIDPAIPQLGIGKNIQPRMTVNYDTPIEEMIKSSRLEVFGKEITDKNFPKKETGEKIVTPVIFYNTNFEEFTETIKKIGLEPANIWDLLALCSAQGRYLNNTVLSLASLGNVEIYAPGSAFNHSFCEMVPVAEVTACFDTKIRISLQSIELFDGSCYLAVSREPVSKS